MKRNFTGEVISNDDSIDMTIRGQNKSGKNLIRSKYADIKIKVDTDVYHLDRLYLASKSDYFEKLFIEDFREKKHDILELSVVDSDTFSTIVDMIYGQELKSVLNADNYVVLLMAMDYFQMKIDMRVYGKFIIDFIEKKPILDSTIFKLCEYVAENKNFDDLTPFVYSCMSVHLTEVQDHEDFLSLPLDQVAGIISGQRLEYSNINDIRQCCRVCVKWIFHDVENRLSHALKLVNAVKRRLGYLYHTNIEDLKVKMRDAGEEVTPDNVLKYLVETVAFQGEIGTPSADTQRMKKRFRRYNRFNESSIDQNERDKMIRFLENGDLYDIVVRIEGKTYKLHRCKLLSESGYFADVFSAQNSETSDQPNKDEEYLLDVEGVDEKSFEASIGYIYHRKLELNFDTIVSVLKIACILKIDRMMSDCDLWIVRHFDAISLEIVVEILNVIRNADLIIKFEKMYKCLLSRLILFARSATEYCSLFCAIPIGMLEDWLISATLPTIDERLLPENLGFYDSNKLVDICSKWVMEDVQNRYQLIPRIARAINCNLKMNCNDYKMETPDLSRCSEQSIRVQLMSVLLSTQLIDQDTLLKNTPRKISDEPGFVTSSEATIGILNCEMEKIVSIWFDDFYVERDYSKDRGGPFRSFVSATTMGDMLFIAAKMSILNYYNDDISRIFFQAYNISSKKFTSLAYLPRRELYKKMGYNLLNCRDDIYCCFKNGIIFKYLMHLNRWSQFSNSKADKKIQSIRFASDGKTLYKLYETKKYAEYEYLKNTKKNFETYDFDLNLWIPEPEMTRNSKNMSRSALGFTTMKNGDVAVLLPKKLCIFDRNSRSWRQLPLPEASGISFYNNENAPITQWEDRLLFHSDNQLLCYQLSDSNQSWQVVKEQKGECDADDGQYRCLASVHKPAM